MYTIFIMKLLKYNYIFWLKKADSISAVRDTAA